MAAALVIASGCTDDRSGVTVGPSITSAPHGRTGTVWARSVADDHVHEVDVETGEDLGPVEGLDDFTGWKYAAASPSRRTVAFGDSVPRLVVFDRRTREVRTAPSLSCVAFRTEGELIASSGDDDRDFQVGLIEIDELPLGTQTGPPPTWVPLSGPPLDRACPHRLDDDVSLLQVGKSGSEEKGQELVRLDEDWSTHQVLELTDCNAGEWEVSPDGTALAANLACDDDESGLYLFDVETMERHRIAAGLVASPSWSPDGSRLAYVSAPSRDYEPEQMRLHVVNADGSDDREISDRPYLFPIWLD